MPGPDTTTLAPAAKRSHGGLWFLFAMILLYVLIALVDPAFAHKGLVSFFSMGISLLPALLLVMFFLVLLNLSDGMQKRMAAATGKDSGAKGWWLAVVGGILSHGPVYAWYPLLGELKTRGMRPALLATFLYARSIKLPWLPVMLHYFGLHYTVIFTLYMVAFSLLNGWLTERLILLSSSGNSNGDASNGFDK